MGLLDSIVYRPYDILQKQVMYQNDPKPVHLKGPGRSFRVRSFQGLFAATAVYGVYGVGALVFGYGKEE
ncbi:hypothetical protein CYLTODRAFT_451815 [Cylindrobasidium torrendii FP15055 ss-10]|uniref:Uncharacterized protein n=1 Tax=Cylindrobasidium torrendii FP15055 ss-10 TaxID=1314674 RepID=A0A0D7BL97_9AGAR|nr:hypothetical protein CYLTODRAFT_451815 [Cylindrobasidium torrendii FP15055 ss-10]